MEYIITTIDMIATTIMITSMEPQSHISSIEPELTLCSILGLELRFPKGSSSKLIMHPPSEQTAHGLGPNL